MAEIQQKMRRPIKALLAGAPAFIIFCLISGHQVMASTEKSVLCPRGTYLNTQTRECVPCPTDKYMPEDNHSHDFCLECKELSNSLELHVEILQPCTPTSPTVFKCKDGYTADDNSVVFTEEKQCKKIIKNKEGIYYMFIYLPMYQSA